MYVCTISEILLVTLYCYWLKVIKYCSANKLFCITVANLITKQAKFCMSIL